MLLSGGSGGKKSDKDSEQDLEQKSRKDLAVLHPRDLFYLGAK